MATDQLKIQKDVQAEVVIDFGTWKMDLQNCKIFSNSSNEEELIFIAQDPNQPEKKVQVTIRKTK